LETVSSVLDELSNMLKIIFNVISRHHNALVHATGVSF
jgi:hypothetical protein